MTTHKRIKNKINIFKHPLLFFFLALLTYSVNAQTVTVLSGDTPTQVTNKIASAFSQGGTLIFESRTTPINVSLNSSQARIANDLIITGANDRPANLGSITGAHTLGNTNTVLIFNRDVFMESGCSLLTMSDLRWNNRSLVAVDKHQPEVNISNVIFDITLPVNRGYFGKRNFVCKDGFSGSITNTDFLGFGFIAIVIDRSTEGYNPVTGDNEPMIICPAFDINRCKFVPDPRVFSEPNFVSNIVSTGFSSDAGNDEFAPPINHSGATIRNNLFDDCRVAISKGSNIQITGNTFFTNKTKRDVLHIEEYSKDIIIDNNTISSSEGIDHSVIELSALQTPYDITITNNVFQQTGDHYRSVISGGGIKDVIINNNTLDNVVGTKDYVVFFRCNNEITINQNEASNLGPSRQNIRTTACPASNTPLSDGTYVLGWSDNGTNYYLRGNLDGSVDFVESATPPTDNSFIWRITLEQLIGTFFNYYTFENVATNNFLEVSNGPTAPQQRNTLNQPYQFNGGNVDAAARSTYSAYRKPGFAIFERGSTNNFAILPGGNELRSHLRKDGINARVYGSESTSTEINQGSVTTAPNAPIANWTFTSTPVLSTEDSKQKLEHSFRVFPNPATETLNINIDEQWRIYNLNGKLIKSGETKRINITALNRGIYFIKLENGAISKFFKY